MKKGLLQTVFLLGTLSTITPSTAQNSSVMPETALPGFAGPVIRPQNASSSTLQQVIMPSGATENLYIHSWDVFSSPTNNGIAWRRTNAGGGLINENFVPVKYANDIDAVLYKDGADYYVLAAYYYDDGNPGAKGHYYDIYRFEPGGLVAVSTMNLLTLSPTFGRINVDATVYGLAITWCVPGVGIYAKAAALSGAAFGPNVLMPGTAARVDPDICIRRGAGGSGSGLDLQMVFLDNTLTALREYRVPFFNVLSGSSSGFTAEYTTSTPSANRISPPRIDCPDIWSGGQKWAISMGINNVSGTTVTEWIYAVVKNDDWGGVGSFPSTVNLSYLSYTTGSAQANNPVVAYNNQSNRITVGWMTKQNTTVIPGTNDVKYVAVDVKDNGTSAPAVIPGSYNMISNTIGAFTPVLAFSGQNLNSNFNGLYTAFSQYNTVFGNYSMMYKHRPWPLSTFKGVADLNKGDHSPFVVSPNPFVNTLSFTSPAQGDYKINLMSMEGRLVYEYQCTLTEGELYQLNIPDIASGTYVLNVSSRENNLNYTQKMVKK
ncbi:T9SS type A sorting domain-containing protein [Taibaiella sp. KBW10]|uniref:T9SS type A sorting domain-containing protein n=1 Tax=Taibaiella sp. KBW10 TaxID=2153357 RepID=UPI00131583EA|nr:T9SS type A sorting domain-containing protein [Taibaiella sp. KBW10]